jgi:DNA repair protein RecO (recombination protein O)
MLQKTEGIVIHTLPYSDTSIITKVFTADYGLLSFMIRGTRGKKTSNKAVLFQPLTILMLDIYYQENKNLQTVKETKLALNPVGIYGNMYKTSVVLFIAEVLQKLLKDSYQNVALFELLKNKIEELNNGTFHPDFHLNLLLSISEELGFVPFNNFSSSEPVFSIQEGKFVTNAAEHTGAYYLNLIDSEHLHHLLSGTELTMQREERRSLLTEILKYFQFHNQGMSTIRSVSVLQEVL